MARLIALEPACEFCGAPDQELKGILIQQGRTQLMVADTVRAPLLCDECREYLRDAVQILRVAIDQLRATRAEAEPLTGATVVQLHQNGDAPPAV